MNQGRQDKVGSCSTHVTGGMSSAELDECAQKPYDMCDNENDGVPIPDSIPVPVHCRTGIGSGLPRSRYVCNNKYARTESFISFPMDYALHRIAVSKDWASAPTLGGREWHFGEFGSSDASGTSANSKKEHEHDEVTDSHGGSN